MQKQKMGKAKLLIIAALLCPACALAQIGGSQGAYCAARHQQSGHGEFGEVTWWHDCRRQYGTQG
jgi:hypothetical protein